MTYQEGFTLLTELLERLSIEIFEFSVELIRILVNSAMQTERQEHLGAGHTSALLNAEAIPVYHHPVSTPPPTP